MRRVWLVFIACFTVFSCAACGQAQVGLADILPREKVEQIRIYYRQLDSAASSTLRANDAGAQDLLDALYTAQAAPMEQEGYSPEMRATHRLLLSGGEEEITLYYDSANGFLFLPDSVKKSGHAVLTYRAFTARIEDLLEVHAALAQVPFQPGEDPLVPIDALLRAEIVPEELEKTGEHIDYELFSYPLESEAPLYTVLTYKDEVPGLDNGYLLIVASAGRKDTGGYEIDNASVEENDSYYIVRVTFDAPAEGTEVPDQPSFPVACVKVDARRMHGNKIIVILGGKGEILGLHRMPRAFFDELPEDMPPLPTPAPDVDQYMD